MEQKRISLAQPDDWHVHFRDGDVLKAVAPLTAHQFGRAIVMPNLKPPVTTTAMAEAYRERILASLSKESTFQPLMTLYLTDGTDPEDVAQGHHKGVLTAAKLYPANATTNSEFGVTSLTRISKVLEKMQKIGMPLLIHGEVTDTDIDIFDREKVFIDKVLVKLRRDFPGLKVVMEHVTTSEAVAYLFSEGEAGLLAATITPHHLLINRNHMLVGGIKPHLYCLPIVKAEPHRKALVAAATSGAKMFFAGTDSAPHHRDAKECACGCAGIFTANNAVELYAQAFDENGALDNFEKFMSQNGPAFYGLPVNQKQIILEKYAPLHQRFLPKDDVLSQDCLKDIVPFQAPTETKWCLLPDR